MKSILLIAGSLLMTVQPASAQNSYTICHHATALFTNATFITLNPKQPLAQAMAIRNHRIVAMGDEKTLQTHCRDENTQIIDLHGATVTPGFIDTNSQFALYGWLANQALDLSTTNVFQQANWQPIKSVDAFLTAIKNNIQTNRDWLIVNGYDSARLSGELLSQKMLDDISTEKPMMVLYSSAREAQLNLAGIKKIKDLMAPAPANVNQQGVVKNADLQAIFIKMLNKDQLKQAIATAAHRYAIQGYTTVTEAQANQTWLNTYYELSAQSDFPVDFVLSPGTIEDSQRFLINEMDNPRLYPGPLRMRIDGDIRQYRAFLTSPYLQTDKKQGTGWRGERGFNPREFEKKLMAAGKTKTLVALECNGDAAIDMALNAILKVQQTLKDSSFSPILINAQIAREDQLHRMQVLNVKANWFSPHLYYWGESMCHTFLGAQRAIHDSPLASAHSILGLIALHASSPSTPPSPLQIMANSHSRMIQSWNFPPSKPCPAIFGLQDRISLQDALRAQTLDAAVLYHLDKDKGSLETGKLADMVIFSDNPLNENTFSSVKILGTVRGGHMQLVSP